VKKPMYACAASSRRPISSRRRRWRKTGRDHGLRSVRLHDLRSLLENAINLERFNGAPSTDVLSYAPNRVTDLPSERDRLQRPVVYHLFGKLSASPPTSSRMRTCWSNLRAAERAPRPGEAVPRAGAQSSAVHRQQFHQLARPAFLRMAKRQRLSDPRDVGEVLGRRHSSHDAGSCPSCSK